MDARAVSKAASAQPRPAAALAFDHLVALLQQALALAVFALLLLLDVGTFFIGHHDLQTMLSRRRCCRGSRSNASRGERSGRRDTVAVHSMHKPDGAPSFARLRAKTARGNTCMPRFPVADTFVAWFMGLALSLSLAMHCRNWIQQS